MVSNGGDTTDCTDDIRIKDIFHYQEINGSIAIQNICNRGAHRTIGNHRSKQKEQLTQLIMHVNRIIIQKKMNAEEAKRFIVKFMHQRVNQYENVRSECYEIEFWKV